jgi:hypothetical protein
MSAALGPDQGEAADLARAFARTFADADGQRVLAHLRRLTFERFQGPAASEAALRHLDGQRALVATIEGLIRRGRDGP